MAESLDAWTVEEIVSTLTQRPDTCILLSAHLIPDTGAVRIRREGRRWALHRYLLYRLTGEPPDLSVALLPGGCKASGCYNPYHRIPSRRRTMSPQAKRQWRKDHKEHR
jgi:hypothetical protein